MKKCADLILELRSNNSRLFKEAVIEREMANQNDLFFIGIKFGLDKLITFGIKDVPTKKESSESHSSWNEFHDILNNLIDRKLTGNLAKDTIKTFMEKCDDHEWNNWYRLILLKDFKCGVNETTINKCANKIDLKYKIPIFSCQLAQDSNKNQKKLNGKKIVDIKLDGVRLLTITYPNGFVEQFTRNGKVVNNFPEIKDQFAGIAIKLTEPMVFDGEIISTNFQNLMKNIFREVDVDTSTDCLYLFDMIPLEAFRKGFYGVKQISRLESLQNLKIDQNNIKVLNYDVIDFDTDYDKDRFNSINKTAIKNGYEGVMIKDFSAPYETKRTFSWLKLKPVVSFDLNIVGVDEGDGKYKGMLGSILCKGVEDGKEITVSVGGGFSDEDRKVLWDKKEFLIGKVVEIACDGITHNQNDEYSVRFPRFVRFRGFDNYEKF